MHLTLVIPGLVWKSDALPHPARELPLPALAALLGRGEARWLPAADTERRLADAFRMTDDELPWGAVRWAGEGGDPGVDCWMCADPVHLRLAGDRIILADSRELAITTEEAGRLIEMLNTELDDALTFQTKTPERWYLRLRARPDLRTHSIRQAIGRQVDALLPEGADARIWRRVISEAQILLHKHSVNIVRESQGRSAINSVWLWGCGGYPRLEPGPANVVVADEPIALGLARAAGIGAEPLPANAHELLSRHAKSHALILLDRIERAAAYHDAGDWANGLAELERDWFVPLVRALDSGSVRRVELDTAGDSARLRVAVRSSDRWKVWRRPRPLHLIQPPAAVS